MFFRKFALVATLIWGGLLWAQVTPIKHIVIIIKENRSFDNYFGTFPNANGATTGKLPGGSTIRLKHANDPAPNFGHSWDDARDDIDGGKMDGWPLELGCKSPHYACYEQYLQADIPNYWKYAKTFQKRPRSERVSGNSEKVESTERRADVRAKG